MCPTVLAAQGGCLTVGRSGWSGRHQVTIALTPNFHGDPGTAINTFIDKAICG
jgi:hypothetical protein